MRRHLSFFALLLALSVPGCGTTSSAGGSDAGPRAPDEAPVDTAGAEVVHEVAGPADAGHDTFVPVCENGFRDGEESDVDCGGSWCPPCGWRAHCRVHEDCLSGMCDADGRCGIASCDDGVKNSGESDIDCGGACPRCEAGQSCGGPLDCKSFGCADGKCVESACDDGHKNGTETDIDCGGSCEPCGIGRECKADGDCATALCLTGSCWSCKKPTDCKGADTTCRFRTCVDGACGVGFAADGVDAGAQAPGDCLQVVCDGTGGTRSVPDGADVPEDQNPCTEDRCDGTTPGHSNVVEGTAIPTQKAGDCLVAVCDGAGAVRSDVDDADVPGDGTACTEDLCADGTPSNPAVAAGLPCDDKGGAVCSGAGACVACVEPADCASGVCQSNKCVPASCTDKVKNGDESDADCGGAKCAKCAAGRSCGGPTDCVSAVCSEDGICLEAVCPDGVKNGKETGVDCGGADCPACEAGLGCKVSGDCASGHCISLICVACIAAEECPAPGGECGQPACVKNACAFKDAAFGTILATQVPGDCRTVICDGQGGTARLIDDLDVPIDGLPCTDDVCDDGVAKNPPTAAGTPCSADGGVVCDGQGACVP